MKSVSLAIIGMTFSFSAFALTSGSYINKNFSNADAPLYKSLKLETAKCTKGGAIAKFYGADAMNFCEGFKEERVNVYKKCIGKELPYPLGTCIGVKRNVEYVSKVIVSKDENGSIVREEANLVDGKVVFEQVRSLTEVKGNIIFNSSFVSHSDGRSGSEEVVFEKTN